MATTDGPPQTPPLTPGKMLRNHEPRSPRPLYFVCREDGSFVPLIAADELPHGFQLRGVPRRFMDLASTAGMLNLGVIPGSNRYYTPETCPSDDASSQALVKHHLQNHYRVPETATGQTNGAECRLTYPAAPNRLHTATQSTQHFIDAITTASVENSTARRSPSQPRGEPRKEKEYCTYWLFHGECAFTHSAKGCRYKHQMPQDPKVMEEVGLKSLPKWWLDKTRLPLNSTDWRSQGGNIRPFNTTAAERVATTFQCGSSARRVEADQRSQPSSSLCHPTYKPQEQQERYSSNPPVYATPLYQNAIRRTPRLPAAATAVPSSLSNGSLNGGQPHQTASTSSGASDRPNLIKDFPDSVQASQANRVPSRHTQNSSYDGSEEDLVSFN